MNTVGGAIALGTLLRFILRTESPYGLPIPTSDEARNAAVLLTTKAQKTGACCMHPEDVKTAWDLVFPPQPRRTGSGKC